MPEPLFEKLGISYCQSLVDALRIPNPEDFPPEVVCRVLYLPSFHEEGMIEVVDCEEVLRVSLTTLQTQWHAWLYSGRLGPRWLPSSRTTPTPSWRRAIREVAPREAVPFMNMISCGMPESSGGSSMIIDGMPVYIWFRKPDGKVACRTFNGSGEDPVASRFSADVLRLASDTLTDTVSQKVLTDIGDYSEG